MWFLMLPLYGATGACIAGVGVVPYVMNRIVKGNAYCRRMESTDHYRHFLRDLRLSGNKSAYIQYGLENID